MTTAPPGCSAAGGLVGSRHDEEQARVSLGWEACLPQGGSRPDPWYQKSSTLLKAAPEAWRQQPVQCLLSAQTARLLRHAAQVLGQGQGERGAPTCSGVPVSSSLFSVCSVRSSWISLQFMFFRRWPCGRADEWSGVFREGRWGRVLASMLQCDRLGCCPSRACSGGQDHATNSTHSWLLAPSTTTYRFQRYWAMQRKLPRTGKLTTPSHQRTSSTTMYFQWYLAMNLMSDSRIS